MAKLYDESDKFNKYHLKILSFCVIIKETKEVFYVVL